MDALARAALSAPDAPAVITSRRTVTYAELDRAASGVADQIRASGTFAGHPVAFWGERTLEGVAAVWGIPRAGVDAVPVDPQIEPGRAMEATRSAGVRGLWTPPEGGFDALVRRGGSDPGAAGGYVVFTSGSEGTPRGVRIAQHNIAASVAASAARLGHGAGDPWLCVLPLFHVGGLSILWRQAESNAPVVVVERFTPDVAAAGLSRVAFASLVPVMLRRILPHAPVNGYPGLRAVLVGGAAADPTVLAAARGRGIPAVPTYGMTETTSQIATPAVSDPLDGTVGPPLDGAEIRVIVAGHPQVGVEGRIQVRGPMVVSGYVGGPDRAPDEWHTTGDLGVLEPSGRLRVTGRADAVIVTGGENVHPQAVESALRALPGIGDARVSGVPDEQWGAVVAAEVETSLTVGELEDLVRTLPSAMRPRRWEIVERLSTKLSD